jgi:RNA 2',3'-cyclic 3'-phosphodiesterase
VKGAATVAGDDRLRIFLALELPEVVEDALREWGKRHLTGGRRVDTFHVTLAFLGSQPRSKLPPILDVLRSSVAGTAPFVLAPMRYRETRSVGMLVLEEASGEASALATRVQSSLESLGVYQRESRPWLPHVTVLRFRLRPRLADGRSRKRPRLRPPLPELEPFAPSGAAAFLSHLHPRGARYEVIESCSLGSVPKQRRPKERPAGDVESGG